MRGTPFLKSGFVGGLNTIASPYELEDSETRDCLNVVSTERGAIRKRYGSTLFTASPPNFELDSLSNTVIGSTRSLIASGGGKLYSVSAGGAVVEIGKGFTTGDRWSVIQAPTSKEVAGQGPIYLSNGVDKPQYWTGAGEVKAWTGLKDGTHYATEPWVPNGRFMIFAGNRVWMTGIASDPSAVWFSEAVSVGEGGEQADPSDWPKTNVVRFDSSDGQAITGIGTVGPYVLVFKESKVWAIHNLDTGENRKLADTVGCIAHRSIVETTQGTFFLTADQGVYLTDGSKLHEMSYQVRPTILAVNPAQRENAAGAYFNNHYYLSFASGTSSVANRTLDYDVQLKSWWLHDLAMQQWVSWEPTVGERSLYGIPGGVKRGVVKAFVPEVYEDSGGIYPGNGILSAWWISPWEPFAYFIFRHRVKAPFLKKRVRAIFFDGQGEIIPLVYKNFNESAVQSAGVVGNQPQGTPTFPVNFSQGQTVFGNEDEAQLFAGELYKGVEMIFGGSSSVQDARVYAPGVARVWAVGFGNRSNEPFTIDSFAYFVQFKKS